MIVMLVLYVQPKVVVSANAGKEPSRVVEYKPLLDAALEMSVHKPSTCIIYNRVHKDEVSFIISDITKFIHVIVNSSKYISLLFYVKLLIY